MAFRIRSADLLRDRTFLIEFFRKYLTPNSDTHRFDWLYLQNPGGTARVWLVENLDTEESIGAAASFPRRFYVRGRESLGFVLGDFCIHPGFRSLGPAIQLQRTCIQGMDSNAPAIGYDFPSESMLAVHRRLGAQPEDRLVRFAKPLRTDRKVAGRVKLPFVARAVSAAGNQMLKWRDRRWRYSRREVIGQHNGPCGREFTTLATKVSLQHEVCLARTAEYLNWRYLANPLQKFEFLTVRHNEDLAAYLVLTQEGEDARIMDLFGEEDLGMLGGLISHAIELLRTRGVITVSAPLLASHRWGRLFERLGFSKRDSCPVITYPVAGCSTDNRARHHTGWFLMEGDRDS